MFRWADSFWSVSWRSEKKTKQQNTQQNLINVKCNIQSQQQVSKVVIVQNIL